MPATIIRQPQAAKGELLEEPAERGCFRRLGEAVGAHFQPNGVRLGSAQPSLGIGADTPKELIDRLSVSRQRHIFTRSVDAA